MIPCCLTTKPPGLLHVQTFRVKRKALPKSPQPRMPKLPAPAAVCTSWHSSHGDLNSLTATARRAGDQCPSRGRGTASQPTPAASAPAALYPSLCHPQPFSSARAPSACAHSASIGDNYEGSPHEMCQLALRSATVQNIHLKAVICSAQVCWENSQVSTICWFLATRPAEVVEQKKSSDWKEKKNR